MTDWLDAALGCRESGLPAVLVTVAGVRGSAPREAGAAMLVTADDTRGTIGGGQLEYQCTRIASELLAAPHRRGFLRRFPLGSNCGQCCGGVVDVLFEALQDSAWLDAAAARWQRRDTFALLTTLDAAGQPCRRLLAAAADLPGDGDDALRAAAASVLARAAAGRGTAERVDTPGRNERFALLEPCQDPGFDVVVFGAGHVGSALVTVLSGLDCRVRWVDSRRRIFPARVPDNVRCIEALEPAREVAALAPGAYCLVMTHSHALDLDIVAALLKRGDSAYCGLIGSAPKRRRFRARLRQQGMTDRQLDRLTCPIGIAGIHGKRPGEIAVAAAADLLRRRERALAAAGDAAGARVRPLHG